MPGSSRHSEPGGRRSASELVNGRLGDRETFNMAEALVAPGGLTRAASCEARFWS